MIEALLSDYLVTLACIALIYVMLTVSLQVTNGLTGLFSLGHPAFMTIGAYVAAILTYPAAAQGLHDARACPRGWRASSGRCCRRCWSAAVAATLSAVIVGCLRAAAARATTWPWPRSA